MSLRKKGPAFWKFNTTLLEDEVYISALQENLPKFKDKYSDLTDSGLKWDLIEMEIRGFTVKYFKRKAKLVKSKEMALLEKLNELQADAEEKTHNRNIILELQAEKLRLNRIMTYNTNGAILRSKVRWHKQGERNTKYFYGLEKRKF